MRVRVHLCESMGWLRLVGSLKLQVYSAEYRLFDKALLQKRHVMLRSLLIVATKYQPMDKRSVVPLLHLYIQKRVCVRMCVCVYVCLCACMCVCASTHCNTLQHTATHCNTMQHNAAQFNTLQHTATHCNTRQHTATHCNTLQHTTTHCNTNLCVFDNVHVSEPCRVKS